MFKECLYRNNNGHRFFRDERERVSVADQSGDTPEQTDDGPLIVEPGVECTLSFSDVMGLHVMVPVLKDRNGWRGHVALIPRDFLALRTLVPVSVARSPSYQKHLEQILMIDNEVTEV